MGKTIDFVTNLLTMRTEWLRKLLDPRRDIDKECGYPFEVTIDDHSRMFRRGDIASRCISIYPDETWATDPIVFETEDNTETTFEKEWDAVQKNFSIYSFLHRADVQSGIGRFGIILIGVDDGKDLSAPVEGVGPDGKMIAGSAAKHQLIYLRTFDESVVKVDTLESNIQNPRYGLPLQYEIQFSDTSLGGTTTTKSVKVHWTRVVHVADNRGNSEIYGYPRLEKIFNRILDIHKIAGGSGEMFWKGGFPGLSLQAMPGVDEVVEFDKEATKEQMEAYMNGLQRYIATVGMEVKSLAVQVAEPTSHFESQIRIVAMAMSVPWRILMGVELGQLASEQDIRVWNRRLERRRSQYVGPFLLRPFVDRMIAFGVVSTPKDGYFIDWEDLNSPSDQDKAKIAESRTNAIAKYVQTGSNTLIPPFHYLTLVQGFSDKEANSIIQAAGSDLMAVDHPADQTALPSPTGAKALPPAS